MIELRKFRKHYGDVEAVADVDLVIERGEIFALVGPNGSGKSTIMRALAGLHKPTSGAIFIDGCATEGRPDALRWLTTYLPQRLSFPKVLRVFEIVDLFAALQNAPTGRAREALDAMALGEVAERQIGELSGGMVQRLGIAITFLHPAPVIILDEPSVNLDAQGVSCFRDLVRSSIARDATVVISSHILQDTLELAHRIGVMANGRLVAIESTDAFHERVSNETAVRVVLSRNAPHYADIARQAGAEITQVNGRRITFHAAPNARLQVVRAIESAGGAIEEFHTEMPSLEILAGVSDEAGEKQ